LGGAKLPTLWLSITSPHVPQKLKLTIYLYNKANQTIRYSLCLSKQLKEVFLIIYLSPSTWCTIINNLINKLCRLNLKVEGSRRWKLGGELQTLHFSITKLPNSSRPHWPKAQPTLNPYNKTTKPTGVFAPAWRNFGIYLHTKRINPKAAESHAWQLKKCQAPNPTNLDHRSIQLSSSHSPKATQTNTSII
jgi:hypothetical protein